MVLLIDVKGLLTLLLLGIQHLTLCPSVLSYCSANITKVSSLCVTLKIILLFLQDFSLSEAAVEETWKLHVCSSLCVSDFVYPPLLIDSNLEGFDNSFS